MKERSDVEFPMWRKKVDMSLLKKCETPIPNWVSKIWDIDDEYFLTTKKVLIKILFDKTEFEGHIIKRKKDNGYRLILKFEETLGDLLKDIFLMSYMRSIEAELQREIDKNKSYESVEKDIPFWEFLDIEMNTENKIFIFKAHYTVEPQFPELFRSLVDSASLKAVQAKAFKENKISIQKQDWRPRDGLKTEIGAQNVIYTLIDSVNKLIYVGEAKLLKNRLRPNSHPEIKDWNYYRYSQLPIELDPYRVDIERMLIRDMASIFSNNKDINSISLSDYKLVNKKIDS